MIETLNPLIRGWGNYYGVGTMRMFSKLDHFIFYRTWRYLRRKYKRVSVKILVQRYYQGIDSPTGRSWQFHGVWNQGSSNHRMRHGKVVWPLLFTKLINAMPAQMFRAPNEVLYTSGYITSEPYNKWAATILSRRYRGEVSNKWSALYKKQKGVCTECGQSLGYLLSENLEIHHVAPISTAEVCDKVHVLSNLRLIHKTCHKSLHSPNVSK